VLAGIFIGSKTSIVPFSMATSGGRSPYFGSGRSFPVLQVPSARRSCATSAGGS